MSEETYATFPPSVTPPEVHDKTPRNTLFYVSLTRVDSGDLSMTTAAPPTDYDTWRAEMQLVHDELERVRILNSPATAVNRAISKANIEQPDASLRNGLNRLPFKPDKWVNPFILREEHHSRDLAKKGPKEWRAAVETIEDKGIRAAVARIVWWDFFSKRLIPNRWPHLDKYLDGDYVKLDKEILKCGLYQAGYSPWHAHQRLNATFDYSREGPNGKDHGRHLRRKQIVKNPFHNCKKK